MGFRYLNTKHIKDNCVDWEKQENIEIKQNSKGFYKKRHYSLIKQRFYEKTSRKLNNKNHQNSKTSTKPNEVFLNTLNWKQAEQQEFENKIETTEEQLADLEQNIEQEIECLQKLDNVELRELTEKMEKKKKKKLERDKDSTWGEFLADNREIAKERYSLKHQGVCISPRYYSDKNLSPRPKMRSVASQIGNAKEYLDQRATGDHNSLSNVENLENKSFSNLENLKEKRLQCKLENLKYKPTQCNVETNQPIINCCYGQNNQLADVQPCQHYNKHQRGFANNREYNYCQEEYYYNLPQCNCHKSCVNCDLEKAEVRTHFRRQITDLNTQHFYKQTEEKLSSPEHLTNTKTKKRKPNKSDKSKESIEQYNENKKRECEERLEKLKEKITKKQKSTNAIANEKNLAKTSKLKQLLKEENAKKLIQYLDQYVDEHEKELKEDLKNFQSQQNSSSSTLNATIKITSEEKYCQVKIKKQQKISSSVQKEEEDPLNKQYSLKTLKMLKKMTIREYKPLKTQVKEKEKSYTQNTSDLSKQLLEKFKNYREYLQKFEKEEKENKSLQILKSPPKKFPKQESEEINIISKQTQILEQTPRQSSKEQSTIEDFAETLTISQESLRDTTKNVTKQLKQMRGEERHDKEPKQTQILKQTPRQSSKVQSTIEDFAETLTISQEFLRDTYKNVTEQLQQMREEEKHHKEPRERLRVVENKLESLHDNASYEEFRYEYGADVETAKTWDEYGKYPEQQEIKYKKDDGGAFPERHKQYRATQTETNNNNSAKPLRDSESLEDFSIGYKAPKRNEEFQEDNKNYRNKTKAKPGIHDFEFRSESNNSISLDSKLLDQENQRRLAELQKNIKIYGKSGTQEPKSKTSTKTFYKDNRKEVMETKEYSGSDLTKLEYKEVKYQQKFIKEYFKDAKNHTIGNEQINLRFKGENPKAFKEERGSIKEHLSTRESVIFAPKADAQSTRVYKDKRRDSREGNREANEGQNKKYHRENKNLAYDQETFKSSIIHYKDKTRGLEEGKREATKDESSKYYRDKIDELRSPYYRDERREFGEYTLPKTRESLTTYNEDLRNDFVKRREFREKTLPTTKEPISEDYEDLRKDLRKKTLAITEHKSSKCNENERRNFNEEIQPANYQSYEYHTDKTGDHLEESHPIYLDYEDKTGDFEGPRYEHNKGYYREERKAKYKIEDSRAREEPLVKEHISKCYDSGIRHSLEEKPFIFREPNYLFNEGKITDSREENQIANEIPRYKDYEVNEGYYRVNDEIGDLRESNQPKYYGDGVRDSLEEKPLISRERKPLFNEDQIRDYRRRSLIENEVPNVKYQDKIKDNGIGNNRTFRAPKYFEDVISSFADERQSRKEPPISIYNRDNEPRPFEVEQDFSSKYFRDKIRDSLMVKQPASSKVKHIFYDPKEDFSRDFKQEQPPGIGNKESQYYDYREDNLDDERKPDLQQYQGNFENNLKEPQVSHTPDEFVYDEEDFSKPRGCQERIQNNIEQYSSNEGSYNGKYRQPKYMQGLERNCEFPSSSRTKSRSEYEQKFRKQQEHTEDLKAKQEHVDGLFEERRVDENSIKFSLQDIRRDFKNSTGHSGNDKDSIEQNQIPENSFKKETEEYHMEELPQSKLERPTNEFPQIQSYKQETQKLQHHNLPEIDKKSQSSSYRDFKEVMDQNLGFTNNRQSQTDYTFETELKEQQTPEIEASSSHPTNTEQALQFLKNLIETSPQLGFEGKDCLNSVTLAAKDLINKISSCQSSLKTEIKTNLEQNKSLEDIRNYNLEEKSTPESQYKDLETPTDSNDNQIKSNENIPSKQETSPQLGLKSEDCSHSVTSAEKDLINKLSSCQSSSLTETKANSKPMNSLDDVTNYNLEEKSTPESQYKDLETPTDSNDHQMKSNEHIPTAQAFQITEIQEVTEEPVDLKFLQQDSYHYKEQLTPQYWQSTEVHETRALIPPQEFKDEEQCLLPKDSQNTSVYCGDTKESIPLNADVPSVYQIESCAPFLVSNHNYRPLPSPRRLAAFDPASVPLKGILKPFREEEISELGNYDLSTQRTISVVTFGNKDVINMQLDSQTIYQKGEEEIVQHLNKQTQNMLTSGTSISQNICQDCQQEYEVNMAAWTGTNSLDSITIGLPAFKQCPCMLKTYKRMLKNYYQGRNH